MDLFLDNTGLHAAGECLSGRARGEADVRGLLQLGTLLVFAERLQINGFELDAVGRRTREIRDNLMHLGLDQSALVIGNQSEASYGRACLAAADAAAEELPSLVASSELPGGSTTPTGLPDGALAQEQSDMLKILSGARPIVLRQFEHTALSARARGAAVFMLAASPRLRVAVREYFQQAGAATPSLLEQLGIFLRLYLNDTLAVESASVYAPAVSRAEMFRRGTASLLNGLEAIVEDSAGALKPKTLGVPAVAAVLVDRSRGDPAAVITEALQLLIFP
ncbi:hypothetical protein [Sulfuritalea sp.]|uniref:hypothetical protein n=1 Tax=Sulfuritalea sp. TaxID=2480090 RepID=UPI001ACE1429|nr:hypothetical protein [Sulfuritalea sp.]MBN8476519.1 hypothetical protein [Sulfuritalea sp.]